MVDENIEFANAVTNFGFKINSRLSAETKKLSLLILGYTIRKNKV